MKFCSITPLKNARLMYENEYVMLLAHLSANSAKYAQYARNNNNYKIMDNSIIELGEAFDMDTLINEAIKCNVDEIILPDIFNDGDATLKKVNESIEWLKEHNYIGKFKLMAVCHAKNLEEFHETFNKLNKIKEIDVIGIPKVCSRWMGSRVKEAECLSLHTKKDIHLLGCWNSLNELKDLSSNSKVRSMDTCLPALLTIYNMNTFDDRNGLTIDLEKDEIQNINKYKEIMKEINNIIN